MARYQETHPTYKSPVVPCMGLTWRIFNFFKSCLILMIFFKSNVKAILNTMEWFAKLYAACFVPIVAPPPPIVKF